MTIKYTGCTLVYEGGGCVASPYNPSADAAHCLLLVFERACWDCLAATIPGTSRPELEFAGGTVRHQKQKTLRTQQQPKTCSSLPGNPGISLHKSCWKQTGILERTAMQVTRPVLHTTWSFSVMGLEGLELQLYTTLAVTRKTLMGEQRVPKILFLLPLAPAGCRPALSRSFDSAETLIRRGRSGQREALWRRTQPARHKGCLNEGGKVAPEFLGHHHKRLFTALITSDGPPRCRSWRRSTQS